MPLDLYVLDASAPRNIVRGVAAASAPAAIAAALAERADIGTPPAAASRALAAEASRAVLAADGPNVDGFLAEGCGLRSSETARICRTRRYR